MGEWVDEAALDGLEQRGQVGGERLMALVDADLRHRLERLVAELHTASLASVGIHETAA